MFDNHEVLQVTSHYTRPDYQLAFPRVMIFHIMFLSASVCVVYHNVCFSLRNSCLNSQLPTELSPSKATERAARYIL